MQFLKRVTQRPFLEIRFTQCTVASTSINVKYSKFLYQTSSSDPPVETGKDSTRKVCEKCEEPVLISLILELEVLETTQKQSKAEFLCDTTARFLVLVFCHANELPADEEFLNVFQVSRSRAVKKK